MGRHVVAKAGLGNPANYREVFDLLESGGVLQPEVARKVRGMAGYRNRPVHDYARIDEAERTAEPTGTVKTLQGPSLTETAS